MPPSPVEEVSSSDSTSESADDITPEVVRSPTDLSQEGSGKLDGRSQRRGVVLKCLESWPIEVLILLMVFADLAVTGVEVGLDNEIFCVGGEVLQVTDTVQGKGIAVPAGAAPGVPHGAAPYGAAPVVIPHALSQKTETESPRAQFGRSLLQVTVIDTESSRLIRAPMWQPPHTEEVSDRPQAASSIIVGGVTVPVLVHDKPDTAGQPDGAPHGGGPTETAGGGHHGDKSAAKAADSAHGFSVGGSDHPQHHKIICEGHHSPKVLQLEHYFHWIGISILGFFQAEIGLKIWMEGWHFWKKPGHILDFIVVSASLMLELCLPWTLGYFQLNLAGEAYGDLFAGLMLTLRILRIVRLAHGLFTIANKQWVRMAKMKRELREALDKNAELRRENEKLQSRTTPRHGGPELVGLKG